MKTHKLEDEFDDLLICFYYSWLTNAEFLDTEEFEEYFLNYVGEKVIDLQESSLWDPEKEVLCIPKPS